MTRKKSRQPRDQDKPASKKRPAASEGRGKDAVSEESAAPEAAKSVKLPAFGFAEDLLKKDASSDAEGVDLPELEEADPRRIFAFADSLDTGADDSEAEAVPVRLETWVAFSLAGEVFGLPVSPVREVVRVATVTRVPHAPAPIRGVMNMRGRVIPVIDLRQRIGLEPAQLDRASRVIVVASRGRLLGLLVDAVHQVIHIDLNQAQAPPDDVMTVQSDYLSGVYHLDDQLILLLDIERALIIQDPTTGTAGASEDDTSTAAPGPA